jgi:CRAL/TRIO domain
VSWCLGFFWGEVLTLPQQTWLHRVFVVNAPRIFPRIFNILKHFFDEGTRNKVCSKTHPPINSSQNRTKNSDQIGVLGSDATEIMLKYVSPDQLPRLYGGRCSCPEPDCSSRCCVVSKLRHSRAHSTNALNIIHTLCPVESILRVPCRPLFVQAFQPAPKPR